MTGLTLRPREYINYIMMSNNNHLLVEGQMDLRFFDVLVDQLRGGQWKVDNRFIIDTAEGLILCEIDIPQRTGDTINYLTSNREKVELIAYMVNGLFFAHKFVGFVDREFREFEFNGCIKDNLNSHNVISKLIWSRGHSIENYFFYYQVLRVPLRELINIPDIQKALEIYQNIFDSALRLVSSLTLTGLYSGNINQLKSCTGWDVLEVRNNEVTINIKTWEGKLLHRYPQEKTSEIIGVYLKYLANTHNIDINTIRWFCHGHLGLMLLWDVFARCIFETYRNVNEDERRKVITRVYHAKEEIRTTCCIEELKHHIANGECEYPQPVLDLLG